MTFALPATVDPILERGHLGAVSRLPGNVFPMPLDGGNSCPAPAPQALSTAAGQLRGRDKVRTIEEIAAVANEARSTGRRIVLAHGVFDLVHMGHVRHLEAAHEEGDVLVVSVTPDRFVNKGPGCPVFGERLRAEMLGALHCVDHVVVNQWPTAEETIGLVRPGAYVKGPDYRNESEDLTGKIADERAAVERVGGRVVYTDDMTFSSSTLLNQHFARFEPEAQGFLDALRKRDGLARTLSAIDAIKDLRVLLVGEAIIDEYLYAKAMGKAAKENIIASRFSGREVFAGGVIAAANHVAGFCAYVEVVTTLGTQDSYETAIRESLKPNVTVNFLCHGGVPTTRKTRFVEPSHMRKLFEVYFFDDAPLPPMLDRQLCDAIDDTAARCDMAIVTDFGHGMMTPKAIATITDAARFLAVNAQTNSANQGYNLITLYERADYVCIDSPEARLAASDRFSPLEQVIANKLQPAIACDTFAITDGERGCLTYSPAESMGRVPASTRQVVDTVGAGDAFLAVTAPLVASGAPIELVGTIGNAVGAMKVGIVGHRQSIERIALLKYLAALLK